MRLASVALYVLSLACLLTACGISWREDTDFWMVATLFVGAMVCFGLAHRVGQRRS